MFADVGTAILASLGPGVTISVTRRAAGTLSTATGLWTQGASSSLVMRAFVAPARPKEIAELPEGEQTSAAIVIFTLQELQTSDVSQQLEADVVTWQGRTYKVQLSDPWLSQANIARSIATRFGI